jgi:two-component system, chemotaxis family, chemotaxis protein CheY
MRRILVVDDSAYARRVLTSTLEREGYEVSEASSGMGAIESYFLNPADVVLLDLTMEDMGGVEVLTRLKQMNEQVRVVVISADVQSTTAELVSEAGAFRFLGKPARPAEVLEAVQAALGEQ